MDTQSDQITKPSVANHWKIAFLAESVLFLIVVVVGFTTQYSNQQLIKKSQTETAKLSIRNDISASNFNLPAVTSWKTFSDPSFSFAFEYPDSWYIIKLSDQRIAVSNKSQLCDNCKQDDDTYAFVIDEAILLAEKTKRLTPALLFVSSGLMQYLKEKVIVYQVIRLTEVVRRELVLFS